MSQIRWFLLIISTLIFYIVVLVIGCEVIGSVFALFWVYGTLLAVLVSIGIWKISGELAR